MSWASPERIASALGLHPPTEEQMDVIAAPSEPALVVAGAGAGKTETMAARVVWLVANGLVTPERVLGLTFTRKAARQLAERIRARLRRLASSGLLEELDPDGKRHAAVLAGEPTVLTYHAYAGRLLAEHGLRLPVQPGVRLLSETASWQLAHRVVSTWDKDLDTDRVPASVTAQVLSLAGELGEHLVRRDKLEDYTRRFCELVERAPKAKGQKADLPQKLVEMVAAQRFRLELLPLVDAYQQRKRAEGALDFADQMSLAARLAQYHPEVVTGERERYGAVLLDEYQDTGHAQRVLLTALFGGAGTGTGVEAKNQPMPITAVGDPAQAIYGWRGASAANLPRFTTDFPRKQGRKLLPAHEFGLLTSFRNPPEVLTLANAISEPLRAQGLGVAQLNAREGAGPADVAVALLTDIRAEREWVADQVSQRWFADAEETGEPPTAAVLVRRRADMAPIAAALRARGLPVEVVGLGGLLDEPEIADLVSTLRVLADPLAGTAAARLLTGARWRLAAADLAALWRRAGDLSQSPMDSPGVEPGEVGMFAERAEQAGLIDAIDDPGDQTKYPYSTEGYRRITELRKELSRLRGRLDQSLPELVSDIERTMLLDVESLARPGGAGRAHLDAFADIVNDYTRTAPMATLLSFVDYLATASHAEDGLTPGEVEVVAGRVQVLTVHAAKGLEWRIVAIPHLVSDVFPSKRRSSSWLRSVTALPASLRGDAQDLPELRMTSGYDRKEIMEALALHEEEFTERELAEERRLCYVALTRSEHALVVSGYWWNETSTKPKGPSEFLTDLVKVLSPKGSGSKIDTVDTSTTQDSPTVMMWAEEPAPDAENPLVADSPVMKWPVDPLGERRAVVAEGRELVLGELSLLRSARLDISGDQIEENITGLDDVPAEVSDQEEDPDGWIADTDVLLAERASMANRVEEIVLPSHLSVSQLVELASDPAALANRLRRPLPALPNAFARRGTTFHAWLEQRFGAGKLLGLEDLPGAVDEADSEAADDVELAALRQAFENGDWASRTPFEVEVPFSSDVAGTTVRGRMDAVFVEPDGRWTVVDWKTGALPDKEKLQPLAVQLTAYRLAWAAMKGIPLDQVRAAFYYVKHNRTVWPEDLLDAQGLRALIEAIPQGQPI